jgi:beta-galactosidase/evolved beta-galactosidase subunit alpha
VPEWRRLRLDHLEQRVTDVGWERSGNDRMTWWVHARLAPPSLDWGVEVTYHYVIDRSGTLKLTVDVAPVGQGPSVWPRFGVVLRLPRHLSQVTWQGRGPQESYPDSFRAQRLGVYQADVADLTTPYVFPQENGSHMDTDWVTLTSGRGQGLLVVADDPLAFSAQVYDRRQLERASHRHHLVPEDRITLALDWRQQGLGSASCGPDALPQHQLQAGPLSGSLWLRAYDRDHLSAGLASRQIREHGPEPSL